jgi:hypothetical protein
MFNIIIPYGDVRQLMDAAVTIERRYPMRERQRMYRRHFDHHVPMWSAAAYGGPVGHHNSMWRAEVGKVTLKSNVDEALSNESLKKCNGNEALNDDPL